MAVCLLSIGLVAGAACKGAPRGRAIKMGPVDTGPGSLEATRRQLEGTWNLAKLEVFPAKGAAREVKAQAVLTYDAYGNLTINGKLDEDEKTGAASPLLSFKGRAVIDTAKQQLRLMDVEGPEADLTKEVSPDKVRKYEVDVNTLRLSTIDAAGNITAKATWAKKS